MMERVTLLSAGTLPRPGSQPWRLFRAFLPVSLLSVAPSVSSCTMLSHPHSGPHGEGLFLQLFTAHILNRLIPTPGLLSPPQSLGLCSLPPHTALHMPPLSECPICSHIVEPTPLSPPIPSQTSAPPPALIPDLYSHQGCLSTRHEVTDEDD